MVGWMLGRSMGPRAAATPAAPPDPYGPNLVVNGTFTGDDATGWTIGAGSSIASSRLHVGNVSGLNKTNIYTIPAGVEDGANYLVEFDLSNFVSATGVNRTVTLGGGPAYVWLTGSIANGHFSQTLVAGTANENLTVQNRSGDAYDLDNFSVRKVL